MMNFQKKILEPFRVLGILLYKCWLVRKRHWIASLMGEILIPISIIFWIWTTSHGYKLDEKGLFFGNETHHESLSSEQLVKQILPLHIKIMYSPLNPFTDMLMVKVNECLQNTVDISGFDSESELLLNFLNVTSGYRGPMMAVIFDDSTNEFTKHLYYKFRFRSLPKNLYNMFWWYNVTNAYTGDCFLQTQICVDQSYIHMKSSKNVADIPRIFVQQMPYPAHTIPKSHTIMAYTLAIAGSFTIPLFLETSKITKEKFIGINVLMSMNGVSNTLSLLSWIISGLPLLTILSMMSVVLLTKSPNSSTSAALNYGNPFILLMVFVLHFGHSLSYAIHLSVHFSSTFRLAYTIIIMNYLATIFNFLLVDVIAHNITSYLGTIFPIFLFYQAMKEIQTYETLGIGVQWSNLFVNANPKSQIHGSVGMTMVLYVIGALFHFLLAIYVNTIKPGKYGCGRHPLFFLMRRRKENDVTTVKTLIFDDENNKYFEMTSARTYTPGIQIRNVRKSYKTSFFSKEKVHALRGVSADFCKGQITSILGHNGAGKSTLMSILTGMVSPTEGLILIDTKNLKGNASEILKNVGFYAQVDMYFPSLTVIEQLKFFAMVRKEQPRSVVELNVMSLIKKLNLDSVKNCLPHKLSEDQKRKLCLGIVFVGNPSILILDEPTSRLAYENKRAIWDILLEMRGEKTILISTHDMEEADILGDKIVIMHEGRIKCSGTALYLKKMIGGQNNIEVTLSIERWSDPDRIRNQIHSEANIIEKQDKKLIVNVPISSTLSKSLEKLERKKKDLGVISYKLSRVGLEQVFLKVAEDCDSLEKPCEFIASDVIKLKGFALHLQSIQALLAKKLHYFWKNLKTFLIQVFAVFIAILAVLIMLFTVFSSYKAELKAVNMQLDIYDNPCTAYTSSDEIIGAQYRRISESFGATPIEISDRCLDDGLLQWAKEDLIHYRNYLIAAVEFNKTDNGPLIANAFYSETISFSLPISINLLSNVIIRNLLGDDYSINISGQIVEGQFSAESIKKDLQCIGYVIAVIFVIPIYFATAMFAIHPNRESTRGLKQLQKMTGVSGFTYWTTMFLSDLAHFALLVQLLIIGLVCVDYSLNFQLYKTSEIMIMILLLMLLEINVLPLVYCCSFIKAKSSFVLKLFTFIPAGIVVIDIIIYIWKTTYDLDEEQYFIMRVICLIFPYVSFLRGQMQLHTDGMLNAMCRRSSDEFYTFQCERLGGLCCEKNCRSRKCQKLLSYFLDNDVDSLKVSVIYLCATPILFFGILAVLECQLIQKIMAKLARRRVIHPSIDEQFQIEKSIIFQKIQALKDNGSSRNTNTQKEEDIPPKELFLAYELQKHYRKVRAVEDVSLRINECDCFVLFGADGSGKSTTLRIMTGEVIPDHGQMLLRGLDFKNFKKQVLAQIGYCSQYDATLKCLNAYDHLRLFARLRGVPENQVDHEVRAWVDRLNLNVCAAQPSSTLSSGNSRRLNIAMALVGNPNLVLLDEPTIQMDPGAKCAFRNTVKFCQSTGQTFLLATHNIEDCEALCKRMVTMVDGKMVFIGSPEELKLRFGPGYDVQIRINPAMIKNQLGRIKKDMCLLLNCVLTNENIGYLMYHVIGAGTTWRKIYEVLNKIKTKYDCVDDFVIVVRLST